jgi:hypothetical protein
MTPLFVFALVLLAGGAAVGSEFGHPLLGALVGAGLIGAFVWKAVK